MAAFQFFLFLSSLSAAVPVHVVDGSYVRDWLVLGPFPSKTLEPDFFADLGGEANIQPVEGQEVITADGNTLAWQSFESPFDHLFLEPTLGHQQWSVAYLYCELEAGEEFESLVRMQRLPASCWINGEKLKDGPASIKRNGSVPVFRVANLKKGKNRCLLKVLSGLHEWTFGFQPLPREAVRLDLQVFSSIGEPAGLASIDFFEQDRQSWSVQTDAGGYASVSLFPSAPSYDIRVTLGQEARWLEDVKTVAGERRRLEVKLVPDVSISGSVSFADGTPQPAVVVQAIHLSEYSESESKRGFRASEGRSTPSSGADVLAEGSLQIETPYVDSVLALRSRSKSVLSQPDGSYQFVGLLPGRYRVRTLPLANGPESDSRSGDASDRVVEIVTGRTQEGVDFQVPNPRQGAVRKIVATRGLSTLAHRSVHRSRDGMLWVGTRQGLVTGYDGGDFVRSIKVPANDVVAMTMDSVGRNWVATSNGIGWFRDFRSETLEVEADFEGKSAFCIVSPTQGAPIFGTRTGILTYADDQLRSFGVEEGLPCNDISALLEDRDGVLWLGSTLGLIRKVGDSISAPLTFDGFQPRRISTLHQASDGAIWFGIIDVGFVGGAYRFDGVSIQRLGVEDGLPSSAVYDIEETTDGVLWLATHGGLARFDGRSIVNHTTDDYFGTGAVFDIHVDADDVLWLAKSDSVFRFAPKEAITLDARSGLRNQVNSTCPVLCFEPDAEGGLWVGGEWGGLHRVSGGVQPRLTSSHFSGQYVRQLELDREGELWIGQSNGIGLFSLEEPLSILQRRWIIAMAIDDNDGIWFGNGWYGGGVSHYDRSTKVETVFDQADGLPHQEVWALAAASGGKTLVGTSKGLRTIDSGTLAIDRLHPDLLDMSIFDIRAEADGAWLIAGSEGVYQVKDSELIEFNPSKGFPEGVSWCSAKTSDGVLWVGTDEYGLIGYDGRALTTLDTRDGLAGNSVFCMEVDEHDALWLGFREGGMTRYQRSKSPPSAHWVRVSVGNQTVTDLTKLPAATTGDRLTIEYGGIDLKTLPEKWQFCYRLADDAGTTIASGVTQDRSFDWVPTKGGQYLFEVQAIDRDLNYSEPARLTIETSVPWHSNPWVIAPSVVALMALVIWAGVGTRLYIARRREATRADERARIARDLHDQMGAGLTHVAMLGDMLREQCDRTSVTHSLASNLSESAHELSRTVGQVIWSADPMQDTVRSFVSYVHNYAERYFSENAIRLRFDLPTSVPDLPFDAGFRHEVFMVVKEALNNVAKHSQATELRIEAVVLADSLEITIKNDGPGFDRNAVGSECRGIANMEKRINDLGGDFELQSSASSGTKIKLVVPFSKKRTG